MKAILLGYGTMLLFIGPLLILLGLGVIPLFGTRQESTLALLIGMNSLAVGGLMILTGYRRR